MIYNGTENVYIFSKATLWKSRFTRLMVMSGEALILTCSTASLRYLTTLSLRFNKSTIFHHGKL